MAPSLLPGEPKQSPKPQPIGNELLIFLVTTCALCGLFLLWRRADALRRVVSMRLKSLTRRDGQIRLSIDDGPSHTSFLGDDFDDDNEHIRVTDSEALAEQMKRATQAWSEPDFRRLAEHTSSQPLPDVELQDQPPRSTVPAGP